MRYVIWIYLQDNGDGSVAAKVFNSEADAEEYAQRADDAGSDRHEGDVESRILLFDGTDLVNPDLPDA